MLASQILAKIKKEQEYKDPYPAPVESGLPPLNSKMILYNALSEKKTATDDIFRKKVLKHTEQISKLWEWSLLEQKKKQLRKLFKDSDKVVVENKASASRFREIIREKATQRTALELQMLHLKSDLNDYKKVIFEMENYVNEYSIYEHFLESVAQNATEFNSVGDILNRFETLESARKDCTRLLEKELKYSSQMRSEMVELMEEKSTQLKNLNNLLVVLQVHQKQAKEKRMYWEHMVEWLKSTMKTHEEELVVIGGGCWDLYRQMCIRRGVPSSLKQCDIRAQLDFIQKSIVFYKEVNIVAGAAKQTQSGPPRLTK